MIPGDDMPILRVEGGEIIIDLDDILAWVDMMTGLILPADYDEADYCEE